MRKRTNLAETENEDVSLRSTKEQIFTAYQTAMAELDRRADEPSIIKQNEKKAVLLDKAKQNDASSIVNTLANLKVELIKQVDSLSEQLLNEFTKLKETQEAVAIEQAHLKELYDINETAKTLSALILAQQEENDSFEQKMAEETEKFDQEMAQKTAAWKQQQDALTTNYKELKEQLEKMHKREEDDYKYNLELKRKKEMDEYLAKKNMLEKELITMKQELNEREKLIKSQEAEFAMLQQKVAGFAKELTNVREETAKNLREQLETQYKYAKTLRDKEVEGELKLNEQKITALEIKIKEQEQRILQLTQKADMGVEQIQAIACRALDTSAQRFNIASYQTDEKLMSHRKMNDESLTKI
jgi:hypothetical protein